jgi:xylulokinase
MREAGAAARRLVAVGGGTKSRIWSQIVTDVAGSPQVIPAQTIGASLGDAYLAARGVGLADAATRWEGASVVLEPDPANRARYDELYGVYRASYEATKTPVHALAAHQERTAGG